MSAVAAVAQAHTRVDGIWFVFLLLLSIGVVLMVNGAASLVTRRLGGHDAPPGTDLRGGTRSRRFVADRPSHDGDRRPRVRLLVGGRAMTPDIPPQRHVKRRVVLTWPHRMVYPSEAEQRAVWAPTTTCVPPRRDRNGLPDGGDVLDAPTFRRRPCRARIGPGRRSRHQGQSVHRQGSVGNGADRGGGVRGCRGHPRVGGDHGRQGDGAPGGKC